MSEQNNGSGAGIPFNIFGNDSFNLGGDADVADPFAVSSATPATPTVQENPFITPAATDASAAEAAGETPAQKNAVNTADPISEISQPKAEPEAPAEGLQNTGSSTANPLAAALEKAEEKQTAVTAQSLFSRPPVFSHAAVNEDIADEKMTFEQLRVEKSDDFPELSDSKRVSWSVEYCGVEKKISTPTKEVIHEMKKKIEQSAEFLTALKKFKGKETVCRVKPKVIAQSKGIASYKGIFTTLEEAEASDKVIRLIPARDGYIYEQRRTNVGTFTSRTDNVQELSEISAGFVPALPLLPFELFQQIIAFFRYFMNRSNGENEALVHVYWDNLLFEHLIVVPAQNVGKAFINVANPPLESDNRDRYEHVADIHSHNSMSGVFSAIDDADEHSTRVYMVVGMLDTILPQISTRISVGKNFVAIDARKLVHIPSNLLVVDANLKNHYQGSTAQHIELSLDNSYFPQEWIDKVSIMPKSNIELATTKTKPLWLKRLYDRMAVLCDEI